MFSDFRPYIFNINQIYVRLLLKVIYFVHLERLYKIYILYKYKIARNSYSLVVVSSSSTLGVNFVVYVNSYFNM